MVQTIVTPKKVNVDISVLLPDDYVGKKVHVLFYTDEEMDKPLQSALPKKKPSDYFGTLSPADGEQLQEHITNSRNEWERDFSAEDLTNQEVLAGIKEGLEEMNLVKAGKLKARPIQDLLDKL